VLQVNAAAAAFPIVRTPLPPCRRPWRRRVPRCRRRPCPSQRRRARPVFLLLNMVWLYWLVLVSWSTFKLLHLRAFVIVVYIWCAQGHFRQDYASQERDL
jgi:hypothetical protein